MKMATVARPAVPARLAWGEAEVVETIQETPRVRTLTFDVPDWPGHRPGQHVDVRLTAEDGYQAQRSYSIASAPDGTRIDLTVELLEDGEVSPYLVDEIRAGDVVEIRGPIGGFFVWDESDPAPVLLVGGGSGVVPLMAMARRHAAIQSEVPMRLLYSSRSIDDVIYAQELERLAADGDAFEVAHTLTRSQPQGWTGYARRVDRDMLRDVAWPSAREPLVLVCGPTPFVEAVATLVVELGYRPERVKTERFGPTGG
jgi:ferredoxin-NADP reductase